MNVQTAACGKRRSVIAAAFDHAAAASYCDGDLAYERLNYFAGMRHSETACRGCVAGEGEGFQ
jgi:hypothetical protein